MKKLILPLVMGLMLGSCSRDNDDAANNNAIITPVETPILPIEMVEEYRGERIVSTFKYDGDKIAEILQKSSNTFWTKYTFTYTGDNITKIAVQESDNDNAEYNYIYKNGKMLSSNYVFNESDYQNNASITYTYNQDGTITATENIIITNSQDANYRKQRTRTTTLTLNENQDITYLVFRDEYDSFFVDETKTTTQYDTKFSPFKNIKGLSPLVWDSSLVDIIEMTKYNITSQRRESKYTNKRTLSSNEIIKTYTFTNEFNTHKYPTKSVKLEEIQYSDGSPNETRTTTYTFTYNK